jgi:hypothetical protein
VVVAVPLSLTGSAAPVLWLVVARTGALLALAGAWRLARLLGLAGVAAGLAAAAVVALSPWWLFNAALGNSEGLLAAAVTWAAVFGLEGRPAAAWWCGVAAGLLRPEIWPFLAVASWWLWRAGARRHVLAGGALLAVLWFAPDVAGEGGALGASSAARGPASSGSAANADVPGLAVLWDAVTLLTVPALVAALALLTRRPAGATGPGRPPGAGPRRAAAWVALAAAAYVVLVALAAQGGYAGNPRYLVPAAALAAALAGAGAARRRWGPLLLVGAVALLQAGDLRAEVREVHHRAQLRAGLDTLLERAGGATALERCGSIHTSGEKRTLVGRRLDVPLAGLRAPARAPGSLLRAEPNRGGPLAPAAPPGWRVTARAPGWELRQACDR